MRPRYSVTVGLSQATSVQEVSKVFEGLHALARAGEISLEIGADDGPPEPRVVRLVAIDRDRGRRLIALDLADQPELFSAYDLREADAYFKRSLRPGAASRVRPFGLNSPAISLAAALRVLNARRRIGRTARELLLDARHVLALPDPGAFECRPEVGAEPAVLLQTRLWAPEANGDAAAVIALNDRRAALVRALRKAFGRRFIGGIVPNEFAMTHFRDLITTQPYGMRAYPRVVKSALVGVCSHGLHDSVPFKFGEYLGASRCIVAQRPTAVLHPPLVESLNYEAFDTPDECVAACEHLLANPIDALEMRQQNWLYYCSQVRPAAQMLGRLDEAFAS